VCRKSYIGITYFPNFTFLGIRNYFINVCYFAYVIGFNSYLLQIQTYCWKHNALHTVINYFSLCAVKHIQHREMFDIIKVIYNTTEYWWRGGGSVLHAVLTLPLDEAEWSASRFVRLTTDIHWIEGRMGLGTAVIMVVVWRKIHARTKDRNTVVHPINFFFPDRLPCFFDLEWVLELLVLSEVRSGFNENLLIGKSGIRT
jgi:hypothetical protein